MDTSALWTGQIFL